MISLEDCIAMCGLDAREIDAIAEHENISPIAAAALASQLLRYGSGETQIRQMLMDNLHAALTDRRHDHARMLLSVAQHFLEPHPRPN